MNVQDPSLGLLRETTVDTIAGSIFLFIGLTACLLALLRHRSEFRLLVWTGLFIGLYGSRMLAQVAGALQLAPHSPWPARIEISVNYVLVIPALLFWVELCTGALRRIFIGTTVLATLVATLGLSSYILIGNPSRFLRFNSLFAIFLMFVIGVLVLIPTVAGRYLLLESRLIRILMPAIACLSVFVNVRWYFGVPPPHYIEPVTFAGWIAALGYEAAKHTFEKERRLFSIESELETARQIQSSILPDYVPSVSGLRIAATYRPMSAVAGDFYQFLDVDDHRLGILVADVTGHGVPAALIASMIKVAMQSAVSSACSPSQVLGHLNRILTPELKGRLTSAAYLWLDTGAGYARYSAAGHPPLLHWKAAEGRLRPVECNGLLFGVASSWTYPECELKLECGDRLLLYTDGLIEPENARGESFGDRELGHAIEAGEALVAQDLAPRLLSALSKWQPRSAAQQDDITLLVIDIVSPGVGESVSCPAVAAAGLRTD
jgi:sigma-B regulation protein RsbU (phosphoserine phosphatase)